MYASCSPNYSISQNSKTLGQMIIELLSLTMMHPDSSSILHDLRASWLATDGHYQSTMYLQRSGKKNTNVDALSLNPALVSDTVDESTHVCSIEAKDDSMLVYTLTTAYLKSMNYTSSHKSNQVAKGGYAQLAVRKVGL